MKTIPLRFITETDLVSEAIRVVTFSEWSHVEFGPVDLKLAGPLWGMEPHLNFGYVGAHAGGGIQVRPLDYCTPSRERRYQLPVTDEQWAAVMTSVGKDIGKTSYDYLGCVGLFLHNRGLHVDSREICSEWVFQKLWDGGVMMLNVLPDYSHLVDPEKLHLSSLLINHGVSV